MDSKADSDDASTKKPVKRSRKADSDDESKRYKKTRSVRLNTEDKNELQTILSQLKTTSLSELSLSQQILLLFSLYRTARSMECVKEEQDRRSALLNSLLLEDHLFIPSSKSFRISMFLKNRHCEVRS